MYVDNKTPSLLPVERIENKILLIRGEKVMLDCDLAGLYGVAVKVLNQAVKRNKERFPEDFMFQLTKLESEYLVSENIISLRLQNVTLKNMRGKHIKFLPYVFTEQYNGLRNLDRYIRYRYNENVCQIPRNNTRRNGKLN